MKVQEKYKSLFEDGKYKDAIDHLKEYEKNFDPSIFHYNLGVNYALVNELPLSRYHLEKAEALGFKSIKTMESLEKVKEELGVVGVETKSSFSEQVTSFALDSSIATGANISLLLLLFFLIKFKSIKNYWLRGVIAIFCTFPFVGQFYIKNNYTQAIAIEKLDVLRGPSAIFEQTQEIVPGMSFILSKKIEGWIYIYSPQSHSGWVKNKGYRKL